MASKVNPIPDPARSITPYLIVRNAGEMIDFYKKVFGATEKFRLDMPDGRIGHAELAIGGAAIMLSDEFPDMGFLSPIAIGKGRSPVAIHIYVEDIDATYRKALAAGATTLREPETQFYGDRNAQVKDPSGHSWDISSHVEDVSPDEMKKRMAAMSKQAG
ncbi:MAG: VOC family protein [Candidatus Binataceae bacterium]